jgi:hypothetical protein
MARYTPASAVGLSAIAHQRFAMQFRPGGIEFAFRAFVSPSASRRRSTPFWHPSQRESHR